MAKAAPPLSGIRARLRGYQNETVEFMLKRHGRGIDGSEMGVGKTPTALATAHELINDSDDVLILCPKIAMGTWVEHVQEFLDREATIYHGSPDKRSKIDVYGRRYTVAPYSMVGEILERRRFWPLIICDEAQWLRNRSAKTRFPLVQKFASDYILELTGSPLMNHGADIWTLLNLIDYRTFNGYWKFVKEWFVTYKGFFGGIEVACARDTPAFEQFLAKYMIRHEKKNVLPELPPKIRQRIPVEMTPQQAKIYRQIAKEMLVEWGDGEVLLVPNKVAQLTRLRQTLVTPALIGGPNSSGALTALSECLANEFEAERACVVFTPFVAAIPYIEAIVAKHHAWSGVIKGGMSGMAIDGVVKEFQANKSHKKVIIASVLQGAGWTANTAATAFFIGYDWTPPNNWQAEDRLHRFGQTDVVHANYFVHDKTVDTHVLKVLDGKMSWQDLISRIGARALLLPEG